MTVVAVVTVFGGCVTQTYTKDNDDSVVVIDLDCLEESPDCPICHEYLVVGVCTTCKINWDDFDEEKVAMKILREEL